MKLKEGDEYRVDAQLVLGYQEPDESVGIYAGFYVIGLEVNGKLVPIDLDGPMSDRYKIGKRGSETLDQICTESHEVYTEKLYEDMPQEEED